MEHEQQPQLQLAAAYKYTNILGESYVWSIVDLETRTQDDSNWRINTKMKMPTW